jgi:hypothetical protein
MKLRYLAPALMLLMLSSFAQGTSPIDERKGKIDAIASAATKESLERKARSEARLVSEGVPINKYLPAIEDVRNIKRRTKDEIAWRAMALLVVALKGEGLEQPIVEKLVKDHGLKKYFTPREAAFIRQQSPSEHDRIQFSWRYEAAWTLLWALGYVEKLEKPTKICDVQRAAGFLQERTSAQFIADAKLRTREEIADEADLIYRYHWAVVDAIRIHGQPAPAELEPDVTMERHYALNWLIGYMGQAWDDISTDT